MKTVIALYDHLSDANDVVQSLREKGFTGDDITLMAHDADNRYSQYLDDDTDSDTKADKGAAAGAGIGAVVGAIGGFLFGTGVLFLPGVGPVLAAGPLASTLIGAAGGAAAGGIVGALIGLGIPEEEAHAYAEGLRRGGTIVAVRAGEDRAETAADVLGDHNPVDLEKRSEAWQESGWSGEFNADNEETYTSSRIEKEYNTYPDTHRASAGRMYSPRADVIEEEYSKREPEYRRHFEKQSEDDVDFEKAKRGYRFGTMLGADGRYAREEWNRVKAQAHKNWANQSDESWDKVKGYVKYGWYKTKEEFWDATT